MNNKFVILIGSRNNEKWVEANILSVLSQDYQNYKVVYFNDASTDATEVKYKEIVKDHPNFIYVSATERKQKTWFFCNLENIIDINDNDILVFLDGDDMLYCENVLSYIDAIYKQTQCWVTYGGMIVLSNQNDLSEPYPQNSEIPDQVIRTRSYRKDLWRTSHLKTMRGFVWNKINKNDLMYDNKYILFGDDLVMMFSALELCPPDKVYRVTDPIYVYNHSDSNNGSRSYIDYIENKINYEKIIRDTPPYAEVSYVIPTLAGGLGNQMFEIAAAASLAKDNNALLIINNNEHILPNQGKNVNVYTSNVFSKIPTDFNLKFKHLYTEKSVNYSPIPYNSNLKINGHFQSFKYFDHNKDYIRNLFINKQILEQLKNKYNIPENSTAIQVRRGDYIKFPNAHPILPVEYYKKAVESVVSSKIYIFSDDIAWCKENLIFENICVEYIEDQDYNELYLISLCKNIIISNSSFGWWAAYLHQEENANIIVPSVWFGKEITQNKFNYDELIPSDWKRILI